MAGKSRRQRMKQSAQSKQGKGGPDQPVLNAPPPVKVPTVRPVSSPKVAAPSVRVSAPSAVSHPYIAAELRTISILAVIMIAILIVLAFILS